MAIITKLKIYAEAYLAQRSGIPASGLVEARSRTLMGRAPKGIPPTYHSVQPDGSTVAVEPEMPEQDFSDELALRTDMGDTYSNLLQKKAAHAIEEISRHEVEVRDQSENIREHRERHDGFLMGTHNYYSAKSNGMKNMLVFIMVSLGEIGAMLFLFTDFFGIDPMRLGKEISRHPLPVFTTVLFTIGFFVATLLISDKALHGKRPAIWLTALVITAVLVGEMRAMQAVALQESDMNTWFLTLLYSLISLIFPLAAAYYAKKWKDASDITGPADSMLKRLNTLEQRYTERLLMATRERQAAGERLDGITREFVTHYQRALSDRNKTRYDWESHMRRVEAYLAELRLAYLFWEGWHAGKLTIPRPLKRIVQAAALLLGLLALALIGSRSAHAGECFSMALLCDRSSSAWEYSCSPEMLEQAGRMWADKADEAGGGRFEVFLIDKSFDTTRLLFSERYPARFPGPVTAHKKKWRVEFLHRLKSLELPVNTGSAIAEAVYRCSLRLPSEGETLIYVLSDMREVDGTFNFERRVPSEKEFLAWLDTNAVNPKFDDHMRLVVCGMHPYTPEGTSQMTAQNYERLLGLWRAVFEKWGLQATFSEDCDFGYCE